MIAAMQAFMSIWTFVGACVAVVLCYDIITRNRRR